MAQTVTIAAGELENEHNTILIVSVRSLLLLEDACS